MDYYLTVWRKYADFSGRARRSEYWLFALINFCASVILELLAFAGSATKKISSRYCSGFRASPISSQPLSLR